MATTPVLTKLEAVNRILKAIGESPVSSLSSGHPDAESAETKLDETVKTVLTKGYHCNTDENYLLTRDVDGYIQLPAGTLKCDSTETSASVDVTIRDGKLYDRENHTFIFDQDLYVDIVSLLPFEQLPYALANYVSWRAAREFQEEEEGSRVLDSFANRKEGEALALLDDSEYTEDDANILTDSASVRWLVYRNNRYYGR